MPKGEGPPRTCAHRKRSTVCHQTWIVGEEEEEGKGHQDAAQDTETTIRLLPPTS